MCAWSARLGKGGSFKPGYGSSGVAGESFKTLDEGSKVSYEATQGCEGMQADNVSAV